MLDISNPARPFSISQQWSEAVQKEFFSQGDLEKQQNLPVSPNMDRDSQSTQSTIDFGELIVRPFFETLSLLFPKFEQLVDNVKKNNARLLHSQLMPNDHQKFAAIVNRKVSMAAGMIDISTLQTFKYPKKPKLRKDVTFLNSSSSKNGEPSSVSPNQITIWEESGSSYDPTPSENTRNQSFSS